MMFEHFVALKNLYGEYKALNQQIEHLIDIKDYDTLSDLATRKEKILTDILNQEKIVELNSEQKAECLALRSEIADIERSNLEKLNNAKDEVRKELLGAGKNANLHRAYALNPNSAGEIFDSLE